MNDRHAEQIVLANKVEPRLPFTLNLNIPVMDVFTVLIALVGSIAIVLQLRDNATSYKSSAAGELYSEMARIHSFLIANEKFRPHILGELKSESEADSQENAQTTLTTLSAEDLREINITAEMIADFFEHVWLKLNILPPHIVPGWREYLITTYRNSPALQAHFGDPEKRKWYTKELLAHIETKVS